MTVPIGTDAGTDDRASILLVDDMEDKLVALEALLASLNEPLVRARSGAFGRGGDEGAAAQAVRRRPPRHPDAGHGRLRTAANIKRLDQTKDVPIIFLTGTDADADYAYRGCATGPRTTSPSPSTRGCSARRSPSSWTCTARTSSWNGCSPAEQLQFAELTARLSAVEREPTAGTLPDAAELRRQVRQMGELLREMRRGRTP